MLQRIKKDDQVCVIAGKDKGTTGTVIAVDKKGDRVLVKGVNVVTVHMKPRRQGEKGKIVRTEKYISASNVMPICPETKKPCRVRSQKAGESGKRVRISVRSGQPL
jgi:large subunit ribosomal protein L24